MLQRLFACERETVHAIVVKDTMQIRICILAIDCILGECQFNSVNTWAGGSYAFGRSMYSPNLLIDAFDFPFPAFCPAARCGKPALTNERHRIPKEFRGKGALSVLKSVRLRDEEDLVDSIPTALRICVLGDRTHRTTTSIPQGHCQCDVCAVPKIAVKSTPYLTQTHL